MGFDVPSVEAMTWKLPPGFTALTISPERLNALEAVRELRGKNMDMFVNIAAISGSLVGTLDWLFLNSVN